MKLVAGGSGISQLADLGEEHRDRVIHELTHLRKMTDVLVIDTAAGISRNVVRFIGLADEILVVATPNIASTLDAYGLLRTAVQHESPGTLNVLVNRVTSEAQGQQVFEKLARCSDDFLGTEVHKIGCVWEDENMEAAIQRRTPAAHLFPDSPAVLGLDEIAQTLVKKKQLWKGGKPSRLVELLTPMEVFS
jgi:flagellar biosynthesis protein FlhG